MREYVSPKGNEVCGVLQTVKALAMFVPEDQTFDENGKITDIRYDGESEVDWDSQVDLLDANGERQFEDETGFVFPESQLHYVDIAAGVTEPTPVKGSLAA